MGWHVPAFFSVQDAPVDPEKYCKLNITNLKIVSSIGRPKCCGGEGVRRELSALVERRHRPASASQRSGTSSPPVDDARCDLHCRPAGAKFHRSRGELSLLR